MDAILAAANLEATQELDDGYDEDGFEEDDMENLPDGPEDAEARAARTKAVLESAAVVVAKEEKADADRLFNEMADQIVEENPELQEKKDAASILAEASKEVNEFHNLHADSVDAHKYRTQEEETAEEYEEYEEEEEEDDDDMDQDKELNQTLMFSIFNDKVESVRISLKKGAYYFMRDRHGWTPLHWAASKGYIEIIELLLDHVKNSNKSVSRYVNAQDKITGWTPMHVACINCQLEVVEILLKHKASKNRVDFLRERPGDCIGNSKHSSKAIRKLLGVKPLLPPPPTAVNNNAASSQGQAAATAAEEVAQKAQHASSSSTTGSSSGGGVGGGGFMKGLPPLPGSQYPEESKESSYIQDGERGRGERDGRDEALQQRGIGEEKFRDSRD